MMARLGDVCAKITDGSHNPPQGISCSEYLMLSSKNIYDDDISFDDPRYLSKENYETENKRTQISAGDILLTIVGTVGRAAVVSKTEKKICLQRSVAVIKPKQELIDSRFLMYQLQSMRTHLEQEARGVAQKGIYLRQVENLQIKVPSRGEQLQVVSNLDQISELISLRKQQLAKLDELVKSRFIELFGDPKLNDKGWDSGVVADHFDVKGGKRIPKGMGYSDKITNHPYLRATDMKNETILEDDIHYIDEDVFQHIKRYTVKGGDIYLTNVGVNLGMAGVIPQKFDGASLTENAVKLVPKTEKVIDGLFLAHYINSPGIQEYINERKMSVGVPKLAIFRIETMPLLIPPMDIQQDFNTFVEQTDKSKLAIQESLAELETLKKALMQKYFG